RGGPDGFDRRGDGERLAVPVGDRPAGGGQVQHAPVARLALGLQELVVHGLQVEGARGEGDETRGDEAQHHARAPALELQAQLRGAFLEPHGRFPETAGAPGVTITVLEASGSRIARLFAAMASTRLLVAHVPCSSVSCVNSSSSLRWADCSASRSTKTLRARCWEVITPMAQSMASRRSTPATRPISSSPRLAARRCARAG